MASSVASWRSKPGDHSHFVEVLVATEPGKEVGRLRGVAEALLDGIGRCRLGLPSETKALASSTVCRPSSAR